MSATNRGAVRLPDDAYYTPREAIIALSSVLPKQSKLEAFEPCWGKGAIPLNLKRFTWSGVDINAKVPQDYLLTSINSRPDLIITNPPFSFALEFLRKSLGESDTVVYLLRLNFLGAQKRRVFWRMHPPTHLFPLSKRPSFTGGPTDATDYAWFGWDHSLEGLLGKPRIEVL